MSDFKWNIPYCSLVMLLFTVHQQKDHPATTNQLSFHDSQCEIMRFILFSLKMSRLRFSLSSAIKKIYKLESCLYTKKKDNNLTINGQALTVISSIQIISVLLQNFKCRQKLNQKKTS
jgi:hypothetical protein